MAAHRPKAVFHLRNLTVRAICGDEALELSSHRNAPFARAAHLAKGIASPSGCWRACTAPRSQHAASSSKSPKQFSLAAGRNTSTGRWRSSTSTA